MPFRLDAKEIPAELDPQEDQSDLSGSDGPSDLLDGRSEGRPGHVQWFSPLFDQESVDFSRFHGSKGLVLADLIAHRADCLPLPGPPVEERKETPETPEVEVEALEEAPAARGLDRSEIEELAELYAMRAQAKVALGDLVWGPETPRRAGRVRRGPSKTAPRPWN